MQDESAQLTDLVNRLVIASKAPGYDDLLNQVYSPNIEHFRDSGHELALVMYLEALKERLNCFEAAGTRGPDFPFEITRKTPFAEIVVGMESVIAVPVDVERGFEIEFHMKGRKCGAAILAAQLEGRCYILVPDMTELWGIGDDE